MTDNNTTQNGARNAEETPRQVIPDVSKSAEIAGQPIMDLMRAFIPALAILFYGINMAPDGWTLPTVIVGLIVLVFTIIAVFAAPSGDTPGEYVWYVVTNKTGQGVLRHE